MSKPINVQYRVSGRRGWLSRVRGESQGKALERILPGMNADGYRVAFVVPDQFSYFMKLLQLMIFLCTAGAWSQTEGLLVIGERIDLRDTASP